MKIKVENIVDMVRPRTVVHVGASTGAEVDHYIASGVEKIVLIEPIPSIAQGLAEKWGSGNKVVVYECACMDYDGEIEFHIADNQGMSSSIYATPNNEMHRCNFIDKITVQCATLDGLFEEMNVDLLVIDAQGSEHKVLDGAKDTLTKTKYIFCEASRTPLYEGACTFQDIRTILSDRFDLVETYFNDRGTGDALFKWKE